MGDFDCCANGGHKGRAVLRLCGGASWEIELDGQEVEVGGQCTAHEDCHRVTFANGRVGFFSSHELVRP